MNFRRILLAGFALLLTRALAGQEIESNSKRELNFVFEVKQIDEFFERFNNEENSLLASYVKVKYPEIGMNRESLIKSLFNSENSGSVSDTIQEFCRQVTDTMRPEYLNFYGGEWYAEALCKFRLNGQSIDVAVLLRIEQEANGGAKWVIVSAYSTRLPVSTGPIAFPLKTSCCKFLNPMSHATNFISLSRAFEDKSNLSDYLASGFLRGRSSKAFVRALLTGQLKYQFVKRVTYHFLQIDGWVFTVDQFHRNSVHSGWLVNRLVRVSEAEKQTYRLQLMRRNKAQVVTQK